MLMDVLRLYCKMQFACVHMQLMSSAAQLRSAVLRTWTALGLTATFAPSMGATFAPSKSLSCNIMMPSADMAGQY